MKSSEVMFGILQLLPLLSTAPVVIYHYLLLSFVAVRKYIIPLMRILTT